MIYIDHMSRSLGTSSCRTRLGWFKGSLCLAALDWAESTGPTRLDRLDSTGPTRPTGLVVTASIHDYDHVACPSIATTGIASGTGVSTDGSITFGAIPAQTSTMR